MVNFEWYFITLFRGSWSCSDWIRSWGICSIHQSSPAWDEGLYKNMNCFKNKERQGKCCILIGEFWEVWMQNALHGFNSFVLQTVCVEKEKSLGGTCLNVGCIPSKVSRSEKIIFMLELITAYSKKLRQKNWSGSRSSLSGESTPPPPLFVKNKFFFCIETT